MLSASVAWSFFQWACWRTCRCIVDSLTGQRQSIELSKWPSCLLGLAHHEPCNKCQIGLCSALWSLVCVYKQFCVAIVLWTLLIWSGKQSAITEHGRSAQWSWSGASFWTGGCSVCLSRIPLSRWMRLSTSGTYSFTAVVFTTRIGIRTLRFSNLLSISTVPTWNPLYKYRSMMHLMPAAICLAVRDGVCSAVTRFMPHEMLTKNGTLLMSMASTTRITHWCCSRIALGSLTWFAIIDSGGVLMVRPLTPTRLGPKIRLAFCTAVGVTG